jgi:hypothetical protein
MAGAGRVPPARLQQLLSLLLLAAALSAPPLARAAPRDVQLQLGHGAYNPSLVVYEVRACVRARAGGRRAARPRRDARDTTCSSTTHSSTTRSSTARSSTCSASTPTPPTPYTHTNTHVRCWGRPATPPHHTPTPRQPHTTPIARAARGRSRAPRASRGTPAGSSGSSTPRGCASSTRPTGPRACACARACVCAVVCGVRRGRARRLLQLWVLRAPASRVHGRAAGQQEWCAPLPHRRAPLLAPHRAGQPQQVHRL